MGWKWLCLSVEVSSSGYEVELRVVTKPHGDMRVGDEARSLVFGHQRKTHEKRLDYCLFQMLFLKVFG